MKFTISLCIAVIAAMMLTENSYKPIQILQLSSYRARGVAAWMRKSAYDYLARYFAYAFFSFTPMLVFVLCFGGYEFWNLLGFFFFMIFSVVFYFAARRERHKTPLVETPRVVRLKIVSMLIYMGLNFAAIYFTYDTPIQYALVGWIPMFIPGVVLFANTILRPLESALGAKFKKAAKRRLTQIKPVTIGITGSYGKTTAKNILTAMMSTQYKVLASPLSYNTPMGLCRTVNEGLTDQEIFIAEMGARFKGDIAELVELVDPDYGLITSVGPQHLETLGSLERVAETKFELAAAKKGLFLNMDSELVAVSEGTYDCVKYYAGQSGRDAGYGGVSFGPDGASFEIYLNGRTLPIVTCLLGDYIPSLLTLCALTASKLGVDDENIVEAAANLKPIPHRLQLIKSYAATVIDDAYNSNPDGAACALRTLAMFDGVKVVITPGLVEQGKEQEKLNEELGGLIGAVCDYAIFVGGNAAALARGAAAAGSRCAVQTAPLLNQAMEMYTALALEHPVVLFENDLPDNL